MNNLGYLFAAYTIIWLVLFLYVFFLLRREKRLRREVEGLAEARKEQGG